MPSNPNKWEMGAGEFVSTARSYREAGDLLHDASVKRRLGNEDPAFLLYFHASELALKGVLTACGMTERERRKSGHDLKALMTSAEPHLAMPEADAALVKTVVELLYRGNEEQAIRYFSVSCRVLPDIAYCREGVTVLVDAASAFVAATATRRPASDATQRVITALQRVQISVDPPRGSLIRKRKA